MMIRYERIVIELMMSGYDVRTKALNFEMGQDYLRAGPITCYEVSLMNSVYQETTEL